MNVSRRPLVVRGLKFPNPVPIPCASNARAHLSLMNDTARSDGLCIFSVDVEDWCHILDLPDSPDIARWSSLPGRVEGSFLRLLDIFDERAAKVTCFFLGWAAERYPALVREAARRGHEIASHGYS